MTLLKRLQTNIEIDQNQFCECTQEIKRYFNYYKMYYKK